MQKFIQVLVVLIVFIVLLSWTQYCIEYRSPQEIQNTSFAVIADDGSVGSSCIFNRKIRLNKDSSETVNITFGITANHINEDATELWLLKHEKKLVQTKILFESKKEECDLTIFMLKPGDFIPSRMQFDLSGVSPPLGTPLCSVSSPYGKHGWNSYSEGLLTYIDRAHSPELILDQISVIGYEGSSGAGIYDMRGKFVGLFVRSRNPNWSAMVPMRQIRELFEKKGVLWMLDPSLPAPTLEELLEEKVVM